MITGIISIALCALTVMMLWQHLQTKDQSDKAPKTKILFLGPWLLTVVSTAVFTHSQLYTPEGINLYFNNSLLMAAFAICTLLLLSSLIMNVEHLGLIVLPSTAICIVLNLLFTPATITLSTEAGIQAHIISSVIAFSILCLAAVQAVLLFAQERSLKRHSNSALLNGLPSLYDSETILFQSITLGILVLTVALITGFIFIDDIFAQHLVHKTTLSSLAWIVFVILLWGRYQFGWRGETAIRWSLGGFTFLILAYFGSKFVLELIL